MTSVKSALTLAHFPCSALPKGLSSGYVKADAGPPKGAIAQLGERLNGIQEVGGSIPPGSTKNLQVNLFHSRLRGIS